MAFGLEAKVVLHCRSVFPIVTHSIFIGVRHARTLNNKQGRCINVACKPNTNTF